VLASLLLSAPASATPGGPAQHHTRADMDLARTLLLSAGDVRTWSAGSEKRTEDPLTCSARLTPPESDLLENGSAFGPLLSHGTKEALAQSVHVYATVMQANVAWRRRTLKRMVLCMQRRLEDSSTMMSWISVVHWSTLELPKLVPHLAGYRVIGDAEAGRHKTRVYLDLLLLGRGRAVTTLVATSYRKPLSPLFERRLVRLLSQRLVAA
jgi:hypothetical protein